jgi:two-component system, NarL family, invasion response regulator UvrY
METRERVPRDGSVDMSDTPGKRIRHGVGVLTVDDQAVFRQAAREVVEATDGFEHLGEASCGEEALALADELHPDLVFVDVRMPGIDGLETARRLTASHPAYTIVLISTETFEGGRSWFESCGAVAFVRKEEFGPSMLRRLWTEHGRRPGRAPSEQ